MKEIKARLALTDLKERIERFLKFAALSTEPVEITEDTENNWFIISAGTLSLKGMYPTDDNAIFTIYLIDSTKKLDSGIDVEYIEAMVFNTEDFTPYQYIIYRDPQAQMTYLADGDHKKGSIIYHNSCPCGHGSCDMEIDEPVMEAEAIDLSKFLD